VLDLLGWLLHPIRSWRQLDARLIARDDAFAAENGWTVEVLSGGRRRYRDPRFDQLRAERLAHLDEFAADRLEPQVTVSVDATAVPHQRTVDGRASWPHAP
jgi:hypothetical protein